MEVTVLYGDLFEDGDSCIIGVYTSFEKAKEGYFKAKEKGYYNIRSVERVLDKEVGICLNTKYI